MSNILFIRHAPTDWNKEKRLQGLTDVALSDHSRDWIKRWQVPGEFKQFNWLSSPLIRAKETADCISGLKVDTNQHLLEMDFGDWEGEALPELRLRLGAEMKANEDKGLDFLPPNGESPRMVQARLQALFKTITHNSVLVCHHGVMRAAMAIAFDWPMIGKPPVKFKQGHGYLFELYNDYQLKPVEMHIPFTHESEPE